MSRAKPICRMLCLLLLSALLVACSETTKPRTVRPDLRGQVIDTDGAPIAGATIVLQHETDPPPSGAVGTARNKITTSIQFLVTEPGEVTLWLSSYCDQDTVKLLINGVLPAGRHAINWNGQDDEGRPLPDGVYWAHLETPTETTRHDILLLHLGYAEFAEAPAPLAVTDDSGRFSLDQVCLPFGYSFEAFDDLGEPTGTMTVTRSVRVWAFSPAHQTFGSSWVTVSAEQGATVEIQLPDKPRD